MLGSYYRGNTVLKIFGSFQEVTISDFFGETNPESPFRQQNGIKKKPREKELLKMR